MARVTYQGTIRTRLLNEIRQLQEFRVVRSGQRMELLALYSDPESRLAWVECERGTWRLPSRMFAWAEEVEERAQSITGNFEVFPCWSSWEQDESGEITVEIFPDGYKPV